MADYAYGHVGWGGWMCIVIHFFFIHILMTVHLRSLVFSILNKILDYKLSFFPLFFPSLPLSLSLHDISVRTL